jgi:hypothetical protein
MSKINTRSPYFINITTTNITSAVLELYIYTGVQVATMDSITYSLESDAYNGYVSFEISQLISDYLDITYSGVNTSQVAWVNYQVTETISNSVQTPSAIVQSVAFDGYGYFEDEINPQLSDKVLQSNDKITILDNNSFYIPIQQDNLDYIDLMYQGSPIGTREYFTSTTDSADVIRYIGYTIDNYIFQNEKNYLFQDLNNFIFSDGGNIADAIRITYDDTSTDTIKIERRTECKHEPYRITFINKFGALQSVWMFKRSDVSMSVENENYRGFIGSSTGYDISEHQYRNYNVISKESISLNSGFYTEDINEVFRQLLLSEKIWIYYNDKILPVNIKSKELAFKTQVNDKLIDYKIDFEFAFDKINNVF